MTVDPTPPAAPAPPVTFKSEALDVMREWQAVIAEDRGINPTEANGQEIRDINQIIYLLEAM